MKQENAFSQASWIGLPESREENGCSIQTAYFRLRFCLPGIASGKLSISASSRYRLWINGRHVSFGPCKSDRWRHFYETLDITPYLAQGENLLAVKATAYPPYEAQRGQDRAPFWIMAKALGPCLVVSGECVDPQGESLGSLTTGQADWRACRDTAIQWCHFSLTHWLGSMECVDGGRLPRGWADDPGASCADWSSAVRLWPVEDESLSMYGIIPTFPLMPRPIPALYEKERFFTREMPLKAADCAAFTFRASHAATLPPNARVAVELDAGEHMTAFVRIPFSGGSGSKVTVRYAECYAAQDGGHMRKGRRDDWENYSLLGHEDVYYPSGGEDVYEPFLFRTFRFMRIEVQTGAQGLTIGVPVIAETGYPLEVCSHVESPEAWVGKLWDISVRTLQRCMHETYEDCPYYEQLQYLQDARLEILFTYMVSADTRLALRAIEDFHCSLLPDGMLQARYPSQQPHVIPNFALHWIWMLAEYYEQTGDSSVPKRYRPTVDAVLDWYDRRIGELGLIDSREYWEALDWVEQWNDIAGRTPAGMVGPATAHNLMYARALQAGAHLNRLTGREGIALEYEARARSILGAVERHCWSGRERLYLEGPGFEELSQHTQVYAVLTGLVQGQKARELLARALKRPGIAPCSFTFQFFLFRALEACSAYDWTEKQWDLWKLLLDKNLTTVPEIPDGQHSARSDCHAWGALPLYEFTRNILGVKPAAPGWEKILIEPHPLSLPAASGQVITPKGLVKVAWTNGEAGFHIHVDAPEGVPVEYRLPRTAVPS